MSKPSKSRYALVSTNEYGSKVYLIAVLYSTTRDRWCVFTAWGTYTLNGIAASVSFGDSIVVVIKGERVYDGGNRPFASSANAQAYADAILRSKLEDTTFSHLTGLITGGLPPWWVLTTDTYEEPVPEKKTPPTLEGSPAVLDKLKARMAQRVEEAAREEITLKPRFGYVPRKGSHKT